MKRLWGLVLLVLAGIVAGANPAFAQEVFSFTKAFGAASIPLGGTTSLAFSLAAIPGFEGMASFTDTLPAGLVVATPNGLSNPVGCGAGVATATPGSSVVSLSAASFIFTGACSFSVNVTGTTVGVKNNSVTDALDERTATASITVTAPLPPVVELQNYFSNAHTTGGQGFVNITAPFEGNSTASSPVAQEGEICAMIYVFDTDQALQTCCGCPITADGLLTLSISGNLAPNPLATGQLLHDGSIRILSTAPNATFNPLLETPPFEGCDLINGVCCDPREGLTPDGNLEAWANHVQNTQITEEEFQSVGPAVADDPPIGGGLSDYTALPETCADTIALGSGQGFCTCGAATE